MAIIDNNPQATQDANAAYFQANPNVFGATQDATATPTLVNGQQAGGLEITPTPTAGQTALAAAQASGPAPQEAGAASQALQQFQPSPPTFYKPTTPVAGYDPQTVFDATGKPLSYDQFIAAGGKKDFSNVTAGMWPQKNTSPLSTNTDISPILKSAAVDDILKNDPAYQQLLTDQQQFNSIVIQGQSLTETYQKMTKELGIPGMNTELMNMKKVIEGTEDDIRAEVTKAGGFATESQVQALTNARNKQLIKNYNNLLQTKQMAQDTLNTMVGLTAQDRQFAMQTINQKLQLDAQIADYRMKMQDNATQKLNKIVEQVGYAGLAQMTGGDPYYTSLVEKTLGLGPGGLAQLAAYKKPLTEAEQADLEYKKLQTKTGEFQLEQAKKEAPLDIQLKQAQLANIRSEIANRGKTPKRETQIVDLGNGKKVLVDSQTGQIINTIGANPLDNIIKGIIRSSTSWGDAAYKINQALGDPKAASQYDAQLKAYFQGGKDIDTAFDSSTPQQKQQQATTKAQIDQISGLFKEAGFGEAVGPNILTRATSWFQGLNPARLSGSMANFIADVEQLRSQLNLQALIDAKGKGATFGALSDQELQVLSNSATKIGQWAIKKDGQVVGYDARESDFRTELDKINNFAKLDYVLKGGNADDVGLVLHPDGYYYSQNSDGSVTQLTELGKF